MDSTTFKKAFGSCLLEHGFTKEGSSYYQRNDDVICVVGLQKTNFEDSYYANIGYVIRNVRPELTKPRYSDGDIRARFSFSAGETQVDVFNPSKFTSEEALRTIVRQNVAALIEGSVSIPGLKSLLARRPTMLYQTTLRAKDALGIETSP